MAETVGVINKFKVSVDTSVSELANILLKDYALTTKILKVVNSVHFMQSGQVTAILRAIFLMGIEHISQKTSTKIRDQLSYYPGLLSRSSAEISFAIFQQPHLGQLFVITRRKTIQAGTKYRAEDGSLPFGGTVPGG